VSDLEPANDQPSLGRLVGALGSDGLDLAALSRILTGSLIDALPAGMVEVERDRSLADRMAGREGIVDKLTVRAGDRLLILQRGHRGDTDAYIAHEVRGVTISRSPVSITEWVTALAEELSTRAEVDEAARSALQRLLLD
jgi:hypothetical protein